MSGATPLPRVFNFRPLAIADLPLVTRWRNADHVARWWGVAEDLEAEYLATNDPVRYFIAEVDGTPAGVVQHYR